MTLDEKIGQLIQENGGTGHDDKIKNGFVGSILNVPDTKTVNRLQHLAVDSSRLGIPILFARDVIHGFKTIFPIPLGMAATFNPELVKRSAEIASVEAASAGIRWTFSPMTDVCRDPRWGRIAEGFGEDPLINGCMGVAMVKGYQGSDLAKKGSIAACVKHFAAYGAAEGGRDYNTASVPENVLRDIYLPPFKACAEEGVASFMTAFNEINGIPASGNRFLLKQILQKEWNYDGVVVSDWESIPQMQTHGYTSNLKESAFEAFDAGLNMEMNSKAYAEHLPQLIEEGKIELKQLDEAVRRILKLKYILGLFDDPYTNPEHYPALLSDENKKIAGQLAVQSIVLLKNSNSILPLDNKTTKIAVVGPLADSPHDQMGTWVFDGNKNDVITPLMSLRKCFGEKNVFYAPGMEISRTKTTEGFPDAIKAAKMADCVLLFLGEESILSGESHCRADISLPGVQEELINEIAKVNKPVVAVIMAGRPLTFENVMDKLDAVLYAWHPGTMGGPAIADIITGRENPSGKLPVTFPRHVGQIPIYYNHKNTGKPASDETWERLDDIPAEASQLSIGNTSHYLDYGFKPWFPFGFGLSYTSFRYSEIGMGSKEIVLGDSVIISAKLNNSGKYPGTEVVQLYIRDIAGSRTRPVKELQAFERVHLMPGETRKVRFAIHTNQLGFYNQDMEYVTEPGDFKAWIGGSSNADLEDSFTIK
jgi:beta-glucosidase